MVYVFFVLKEPLLSMHRNKLKNMAWKSTKICGNTIIATCEVWITDPMFKYHSELYSEYVPTNILSLLFLANLSSSAKKVEWAKVTRPTVFKNIATKILKVVALSTSFWLVSLLNWEIYPKMTCNRILVKAIQHPNITGWLWF